MADVIVTVTLNAALDVTYAVPAVVPGQTHRVSAVHTRAGGKGVNVARVLATLGHEVLATGLVGGDVGRNIRDDLRRAGVREAMFEVSGESRRTLTVVSDADSAATAFNEPGPVISHAEWAGFCDHLRRLVRRAGVVVLSGSLPAGLASDSYAELVRLSRRGGAVTVVDVSGPALLPAVAAGPHVAKPNAAEQFAATGHDEPWAAARALRAAGALSVVATLGAAGLVAETPAGAWRCSLPEPVLGNPTGAGDACAAAIAAGLCTGQPWPEILRAAVACSAASVAMPLAGEIDVALHERLRSVVDVKEHHAAGIDS